MAATSKPAVGQPIWTRSAQAAGAIVLCAGLLWIGLHGWSSPDANRQPAATTIDLNRADAPVLMQVPGIGPNLAERIVERRPYKSVDDLSAVPGIGPVTLETIRPFVHVSEVVAEKTPLPFKQKDAPLEKSKVLINVNTASAEELDRLPGIGAVLAQRIIDERDKRPFDSVVDLMRVRGIGKKTVEKLRAFATVDSGSGL